MAKTNVKVELFYSGAWHDITASDDVYTRDPITITRGLPDQTQRIPPSTLDLTLDNRDGTYSPRNPMSALYGLIGRNTPIRVSVDGSYRFYGEVESWPQRWSVDGNDAWAPIKANGILRRLNAPGTTRPALSPLRRAILATDPIAYWPLEDAREASSIASGVLNGQPMVFGSIPPLCGDDKLALGSVAGVDVGNEGSATGAVVGGANGSWSVSFVTNFLRRDGDLTNVVIVRAGDIRVELMAGLTSANGNVFGPSNSVALTGGAGAFAANAALTRPHHYVITVTQSGSDATVTMRFDGVQVDSDTITGATVTPPTSVTINGDPILGSDTLQDGTRLLLGHVAIYDSVYTGDLTAAIAAHAGETAEARMTRLCAEEGVTITFVDGGDTELVGVQRVEPFLELLYDAADADGGILYEPRDSLGLAYRTHVSFYNQDVTVELDYSAGSEVAPPLVPVEDTDATANDVTVTRYQGGFANVVQETGPLNVQEPSDDPDGVGRYHKDVTLVLADDTQCVSQAAWRRHLGTWDEARYPVVNLDLTAMGAAAGKAALVSDVMSLDIADRFAITNPPSRLSHDGIAQLAQGFTEEIGSHTWTIAVNATPARPYDVGVLDDSTLGRLDSADTTLNEDLDSTETGVDIISTMVRWIDSATYASQFPFDVVIGGERMTVTDCSGTGLTQTFTVTRSVNGVVKPHSTGAPVRLFNPLRLAR